ncbi:MAG: P27 family phage terminase small subunit [Clostridiales bacterium]|nr:P27 family phage terminase small subunit [Clostridiales bacterium]
MAKKDSGKLPNNPVRLAAFLPASDEEKKIASDPAKEKARTGRPPVPTQADFVDDATQRMIALEVYKKEFDPAIHRYADMREQYEILTRRWKRERHRAHVMTKDGEPSKRNPVVVALESLRKDLTTLEGMLGLTPQGLLKVNENAFAKEKKSRLAEALKGLG